MREKIRVNFYPPRIWNVEICMCRLEVVEPLSTLKLIKEGRDPGKVSPVYNAWGRKLDLETGPRREGGGHNNRFNNELAGPLPA